MKLAVIGAGNMSSALVGGIIKKGVLPASGISVSDLDEKKLAAAAKKGVRVCTSNLDAALGADIVLLAVKPNVYPAVIKELSEWAGGKTAVFVTIAPGVSIKTVKAGLGFDAKVIRTMPNTPAMVGEGMTVLCYESPVSESDYAAVKTLFDAVGETELLSEKLLNSVVSVSGSSPAYVYMMIEAMADAAVYDGIPRDVAYRLAAQSVLGSARMVLETGRHPGDLKDMVCSPGGTTISAVKVLEEAGFRSSIINAMIACNKKAAGMG